MRMKREIEIKLPIGDLPGILRRLQVIGARRVGRVFEQNTLFDTLDEYFRRHQSILRVRVEDADPRWKPQRDRSRKSGCESLLTFKCPAESPRRGRRMAQSRYKERQEIEYRLRDARRFGRLLEKLGLRAWFRYEKYRTQYRLPDAVLHIDVDETPIGTFLELEGPRRSIDRVAKALGYSTRDYISASYLELYAAECAQRGVPVAEHGLFGKKKSQIHALCA